MEHFSEQAWADFVRGFETSEHRQMQSHLASACGDCSRIHETWKRVHTVALRESLYAPPAQAIRMAKLESCVSVADGEPAVFANLTFDTVRKPMLAGIRSAAAAPRQMLYETDGLAVDLRFDLSPVSRLIHVTGQILGKCEPYGAIANASVIVWISKGLPIAEAKTNEFGEFSVQVEAQDGLRLSIHLPGQPVVRIFLANLGPTNQAGSSGAANDGN